ncbi:MAG: exodeoxyribonuclease III [Cryomorphaceae bacterium]|nr:exodeoxyribonuclease III [Cryomorphaceae bacterium]
MRLISWNVNGIRSLESKGLIGIIGGILDSPDIICFQETKAQDDQVREALKELDGYHIYSNSAEKKGYSGVALLTKEKPVNIYFGIGQEEHDSEGRVLTAEYADYYVVTVYTPNSQNELARLDYRKKWDLDFGNYLERLSISKPVICCGDLNVAHTEKDLARPKSNFNKTAGYTQVEIDGFSSLLERGFIDSFRLKHPDEISYSWWSYRMNAREKNIGWRIDYFIVNESLKGRVLESGILGEVGGSDHCPVFLELT